MTMFGCWFRCHTEGLQGKAEISQSQKRYFAIAQYDNSISNFKEYYLRGVQMALSNKEVKVLSLSSLGGMLEFYDFIIFVFFTSVISLFPCAK